MVLSSKGWEDRTDARGASVHLFIMGRQNLIKRINELRNNPKIKVKIDEKLKEFQFFRGKPELWFQELCFFITSSHSSPEELTRVHEGIKKGFMMFSLEELKRILKSSGFKSSNQIAEQIIKAREKFDAQKLKNIADRDIMKARNWLAENLDLELKESSRFLRNIGYNLALTDFYIVSLLKRYRFLPAGIVLNRKNYFVIEQKLAEIAKMFKMSLSELDLYLWYVDTGKILK